MTITDQILQVNYCRKKHKERSVANCYGYKTTAFRYCMNHMKQQKLWLLKRFYSLNTMFRQDYHGHTLSLACNIAMVTKQKLLVHVSGWFIMVLNKSTAHLHRKHQKFSARWPWLGKPLWTRRKPVAQSNRTGTAGSSRSTAPQPGNSTGTSPVVSKITHI